MTRLRKCKQRLSSPIGQKLSLTLLVVGIFFFATTFAQWTETTTATSNMLKELKEFIQKVIEFISRSWILIASLAGKFMTNDMVYGSWLHLDAYLWKLRNITKNFANFGLLWFLLRQIIQFITKKTGNIQKIIINSVVAGILIQASWFIMAVLLDISTIATAAIGWLPSHFVDNDAFSKETISKQIAQNIWGHIIRLDKDGNVKVDEKINTTTDGSLTEEDRIQRIMPKNDSVSGPLIYIGASTLKIQDALKLNQNQDPNLQKVVTTSLLQFSMIMLYIVSLLLLLIVNIIRIGLLWVVIPLSPIIVLMLAFGKKGELGKRNKNLNLSTILNAIFKPVLFTGVLSLILIFMVSIQNIMPNSNNKSMQMQGTTISVSGNVSTIDINDLATININDAVFTAANTGKNIFTSLILYFATIFLLRYLIKIAATSGGWTIGKTMEWATDFIEHAASTAPIFWKYSARTLRETWGNTLDKITQTAWYNADGTSVKDEEFKRRLNKKLYNKGTWTNDDIKNLQKSNDFIKDTKNIISWWAHLDNDIMSKWEPIFDIKIKANKTGIEDLDKDTKYFSWKKSLKTLTPDWLKILHKALWWEDKNTPKTYEEFKKQTYSIED